MRTLIALVVASFVVSQSQPAALRVVVIQGEDAVNIIQQKTAVRPLVEIRDRNNVPVSGASVTFTVGTGQPAAFAAGAQTVTVTTNAAGQAAATGFTPTGAGAVQIQVQAAHQGQIASAMISQTNFVTAAAAAAAGVAAGAAAGASGGAAAAGAATGAGAGAGGISATTIAIVGAAVGGGAVVATKVAGTTGGDGDDGNEGKSYTGQFTGAMSVTLPSGCVQQRSVTGSIELHYAPTVHAVVSVNAPVTSSSGGIALCPNNYNPGGGGDTALTGLPSTPSFKLDVATNQGTSLPMTQTFEFSGTLNGDTVTGTLKYTETYSSGPGGTVSIPVTLR